MKPRSQLPFLMLAATLLAAVAAEDLSGEAAPEPQAPNIVWIVSDDAGYADFSLHGSSEMATPRIDSIAANGVRFTQGYVSASVCSPSRAGLLTGRYQQRFGHEMNIPPTFSEANGLPVSEELLPAVLRRLGYRTIALGKWHLGYAEKFHPLSRGFDDYFGFLQGSRSYRSIEGTRLNRLLQDREPIAEDFDYMTDELGRRAAAYIEEHRARAFFLYLAFNAVHTPMHATKADLAEVDRVSPPRRRKLAAMTVALDRAVGLVLDALTQHGLDERTLVVFINDNGGATNNGSSNRPLRATKGTPFEGGIRVPFLARWPGVIPAARVYEAPVSTLDLFPTAVAAAGAPPRPDRPKLDGVNLVPFVSGESRGRPHETLYWRRGDSWAIREHDWKLVSYRGGEPMLFDLAIDRSESSDLADLYPDRVERLRAGYEAWSSELSAPLWRGAGSGRRRKK